ncbi:Gfo/Idh/MocA family protein [Agrobacterium sp. NPDC090283]|uniref:Gfo/Idh/MocA family protein n=1 Tax=Agrobacterium sp. NPDC090283 TaxID=3363920 RepID=UPI00383B966C
MSHVVKRIAVAGLNHGHKLAKRVIANNRAKLVGINAPSRPDNIALSRELGAPLYDDIETMLDIESPEGVIVATPTHLLHRTAMACIRRGIHCLIEKPMSNSVGEAEEILLSSSANGARILVGYHRRYSKRVDAIRKLINSNELGRLIAVNCLWLVLKPENYYSDREWRTNKNQGGGPLFINASHEIDLLRHLCGNVIKVVAIAGRGREDYPNVVPTFGVLLSLENEAVCTLLFCDKAPSPFSYETTARENPAYPSYDEDCYKFFFEKGSVSFPSLRVYQKQPDSVQGWFDVLDERVSPQEQSIAFDPLDAEIEHFIDVLDGSSSSVCGVRDALQTLQTLWAIQRAVETGASVSVGSKATRVGVVDNKWEAQDENIES